MATEKTSSTCQEYFHSFISHILDKISQFKSKVLHTTARPAIIKWVIKACFGIHFRDVALYDFLRWEKKKLTIFSSPISKNRVKQGLPAHPQLDTVAIR